MQCNYRQIEDRLELFQPFRGNSMTGNWTADNETFVVWSYSTIIAEYDATTGNAWINHRRYSRTTSRQQNLIRKVWGPLLPV